MKSKHPVILIAGGVLALGGAAYAYLRGLVPGVPAPAFAGPAPGVPGGTPGVPPPSKLPPGKVPVSASKKTQAYATWVANGLNALGLGDATFSPVTVPSSISAPDYIKAVTWFQKKNSLKADGVVGPATEAALVAALGALGVNSPPPGA